MTARINRLIQRLRAKGASAEEIKQAVDNAVKPQDNGA
jgi:hypothetical protein